MIYWSGVNNGDTIQWEVGRCMRQKSMTQAVMTQIGTLAKRDFRENIEIKAKSEEKWQMGFSMAMLTYTCRINVNTCQCYSC